ncbi:ketoacyl-ACP synthase III [Paenibacillus radicis (ex Gao et al. 2016)]|uniref:Beta-ketoacyl-[acyl-carrier-protein] synthase III n=1 Tax=Paenibacillus radicis (ex Gao et al. 2016) TaxID=1737354 RepID=A0A917GN01_9BACL|nr:ketoacyl-ACP synthase III [Paenibacillus radicis (ex Gao et al. 2016)]GGG51700.1 3-oxoacyl-[acyl-carrier-protein] synthase 3 protein 2 [Paenibacillus radicis (ex Gao et al. 2016)]
MTQVLNQTQTLRSNAAITAIGSYIPDRILSNADLEKMVETSDEWIVQRTGIRERRISAELQFTSDLCIEAVRDMASRYAVDLSSVDYIIVATSTPDSFVPSVASRIQDAFGIENCGTVDIQAACAGFTAAIQLANGLLLSGVYRKIIVLGAETLSKVTDYTDRTTCILFGDGAGAFLMEAVADTTNTGGSLIAASSSTEGSGGHLLYRSSLSPTINSQEIIATSNLVQNGREVYRWAISQVAAGVHDLIDKSGLSAAQIDWFVPHNANQRIIDALCDKTGISPDKALSSIAKYGNTSAASIPLAIDDAVSENKIQTGDTMLLYGFGGGLTQVGVILRWSL